MNPRGQSADPAGRALADARPAVYWTDRPDLPPAGEPLTGVRRCDLAIIGGGYTGLWAAHHALDEDPGRSVTILEAGRIAFGASGRNGGFLSASITHGIGHGAATWPDELPTLVRMGRDNLAAIADFVTAHGIEADLRLCGESMVATRPHELAGLDATAALFAAHGETAERWDGEAARRDIASPTYLGAIRLRTGYGLVDPARLAEGLARTARARGATIHEGTPVIRMGVADGRRIRLETPAGAVDADRVIVATGAYPSPLRRLRAWVLPVYDHVLMTEPLGDAQWDALGWPDRQGVSDSGNRFHYYRPTADGRILFGGWDATYHRGGRVRAAYEQQERTHRTLAEHFLATFPQLEGVRFSHRWGGVIDTTSRFTAVFGTALGGRAAYAVGYTGLGVGATRFGARVALDLVDGRDTERTRLAMVRRPPVPFPPEPIRSLVVAMTQRELARADESDGRRGAWLRLLDRFGVGFDS